MSGSPFGILEFFGARSASEAQADAAKQSASVQSNAMNQAVAAQKQMYAQSRADIAPWRKSGSRAVNALEDMIAEGPGDFEASPSYDFVRSEGLNAMNQTMAGMGLRRSGAHAKAAGDYASGLASQEYDKFYNRYYASLAPWQSLAGLGQTSGLQSSQNAIATGQGLSNTYQTGANGISNSLIGIGNARAAGALGTTNALAGSMGNAAGNIIDYSLYSGAGGGGSSPYAGYGPQQSSFNPSFLSMLF